MPDDSMAEAKSGIGSWIEYYNHARKHVCLGKHPGTDVCWFSQSEKDGVIDR